MNAVRIMVVGLVVLATEATAQVAAPPDPSPPGGLTVEQTLTIVNGLSQLDGYDDVCTDGAIQKTCKRPYKFGGGVRWTIASDISVAKSVQTTWETVKNGLITQYSDNGKVPDANLPKLNAELTSALSKPSNIVLARLKRDELKLDENPIPASILALIIPIVD